MGFDTGADPWGSWGSGSPLPFLGTLKHQQQQKRKGGGVFCALSTHFIFSRQLPAQPPINHSLQNPVFAPDRYNVVNDFIRCVWPMALSPKNFLGTYICGLNHRNSVDMIYFIDVQLPKSEPDSVSGRLSGTIELQKRRKKTCSVPHFSPST